MESKSKDDLIKSLSNHWDNQRKPKPTVDEKDAWGFQSLSSSPQKTITFPSDYDNSSDQLSLVATQTDLPNSKQRKLIKEWCELLPTLSQIRILWFHSLVNQELFEAACKMPNLQGLYIKWSKIKDLSPIKNLSKLTHLHIGGAPSAKNIEALCELKNLVDLELFKVDAAEDISFLEQMPQLKSLQIGGDFNSSKALRIKTLKPIQALINLECLYISPAKVLDESLEPVRTLSKLKYLGFSNRFKMEEFAALAGKLPTVKCQGFNPIWASINWQNCIKCEEQTKVMLTGKGKRALCQNCDSKRLEKHSTEFNKIIEISKTSTAWIS